MTDQLPIRFPTGRRVICDGELGIVDHVNIRAVSVVFDTGFTGTFDADWFKERPTGLRLLSRLVTDGRDGE